MASELAERILAWIADNGAVTTLDLASKWQEDHQKIVGAVKSLECLGEVIKAELQSSSQWELTDEGKEVVAKGSHEALVYNAVPAEGISQAQIMASVPNAKVGFSKAMVAGWIAVDKSGPNGPKVVRKVPSIRDEVQERLSELQKGTPLPDNIRQEYKKRKLVQEITVKSYSLKAGEQFTTTISKPDTDLTPEMIASGSWKTKTFKSYNLEAKGLPPPAGHLHPLLKVRAEFRQIFLEMGFTEMPTNQFVESSFWNFDSLFQPQAHPARDAHDTFFLSEPAKTDMSKLPQDYVKRVETVHSKGGFGSKGYGCEWSYDEASKNVLRTHTTAVSARMLYKLAQEPTFRPVKYFSVDRVFRNETLDATHLAEFHQIEGVVADYGLALGDLIGVIHSFFKKLGMTQLRFKPAYNPYTEPSMEIFSFHPGLKKWVEVGNSGLFRPEMLLPMGLPEDVVVAAWGLSLERPTMIKYGYDNIRDLVGPRVNLDMVASNPICRLDKHGGKDKQSEDETIKDLASKLDTICHRIQVLCSDLYQLKAKLSVPIANGYCTYVLVANPTKPPKALEYLVSQLARSLRLTLSTHCHSSVTQNGEVFSAPSLSYSPVTSAGRITWIWKSVAQPELHISSKVTTLVGEASIIRFAARYLEHYATDNGQGKIVYESLGWLHSARIDAWMDKLETCTKLEQLLNRVEKRVSSDGFLVGSSPCIADLLLWSRISDQALPAAMQNWSHCIQALIGR